MISRPIRLFLQHQRCEWSPGTFSGSKLVGQIRIQMAESGVLTTLRSSGFEFVPKKVTSRQGSQRQPCQPIPGQPQSALQSQSAGDTTAQRFTSLCLDLHATFALITWTRFEPVHRRCTSGWNSRIRETPPARRMLV